jgi:hypothetical protein
VTVYIPTVGRPENIRKIVPAWLDQDMIVKLVVDARDSGEYLAIKKAEGWGNDVRVIGLPSSVHGCGAIRRFIIQKANANHLPAIIIAEDDVFPLASSSFWELISIAQRPDVVGIGAVRSVHDRITGGAITRLKGSGPILCPGGWGFVVNGFNVRNVMELGNYDPRLHTLGDDFDLAFRGIARGMPWLVDVDVWWRSLGTRYAPGGINTRFRSPEERRSAEEECWIRVHEKYPLYTSPPGKPFRTQWARYYSDNIPDWKSRSAIHGGSL